MHINTKVVFEWDQDKQEYLEVYSEGYEYSGDLILAKTYDDVVASCVAAGGTEANCKLEANAQGYFSMGQDPGEEWRSGGAYQQRQGAGYEAPPTGYQGYQSLWDLSQGGGMAGYLESEFDVGPGYEEYIRPFEDKPFEFLETGLGIEQEGLRTAIGGARSTTTTGLGEAEAGGRTAYARSDLANVGGITQALNLQKEKLMEAFKQSQVAYGLGMEESQLGYETDVYGEQKAQEERFYDDITAIIQMQQS